MASNLASFLKTVKTMYVTVPRIIAIIISIGFAFILGKAIANRIDILFEILAFSLTLGGFSFTAGSFILGWRGITNASKKYIQIYRLGKTFFELSFSFILSGTLLFFSYIVATEPDVSGTTCLGFVLNGIDCPEMRLQLSAFVYLFGLAFFVFALMVLLHHLTKFAAVEVEQL